MILWVDSGLLFIVYYLTTISSSHRVVGLGVSFCLFMCHDFLPMPSAAEKTLPLPYLALRASTAL